MFLYYTVHRHDIIKSLFAVYNDASVIKYMKNLVFKGENASAEKCHSRCMYAVFQRNI